MNKHKLEENLAVLDNVVRQYSARFAAQHGLSTEAVILVLIVAAHSLALVHHDNDKSKALQMISDLINVEAQFHG